MMTKESCNHMLGWKHSWEEWGDMPVWADDPLEERDNTDVDFDCCPECGEKNAR